ncbi:MAG: polysaccharide biosynthesis/export family protein [Bacteroidales bacterium]|nr:polysaccharide biosynthesis/export family protein [Bacteroidales bacterium]
MKTLIKLATAFIVAIIVFGSCTSQKELMYLSNLDTTSVQQFFPMERPDYRIQYQDILYVDIFTLNPEMNEILNPGSQTSGYNTFRDASNIYVFGYTVSNSGTISIPILGEVKVYGLTTDEIKKSVEERAKQYLKDAVINIKLLSFKFTVIGEVNHPGSFTNYNNQLTVLEAIGMASDITDYGNRKRVLVVRPTKEGTHTFRINLQDKNLLQSEGYFLLPNDIVIVEPIKSKPFQLNIPTTSLLITTTLSTVSTLILLLSFINTN